MYNDSETCQCIKPGCVVLKRYWKGVLLFVRKVLWMNSCTCTILKYKPQIKIHFRMMPLICWLLCSRNNVKSYIDSVEYTQYLKSFYKDFKHYIELVRAFLEDLRYVSDVCCLFKRVVVQG